MFYRWDLRDSKFPQISRTILGILADLNNAVSKGDDCGRGRL